MKKLKKMIGRCLLRIANCLPCSCSVVNLGQNKIRRFCGHLILKECGRNVIIEKQAVFDASVCLGDNSGLGVNSMIGPHTRIGNNVMMGPNVKIYTQNHETSRIDIPMCEQGVKPTKPVVIGNDVWIGDSVIILPGSSIGNGVILGAGSVIRGMIPDNAVVIGNPGQIIKFRGR